MAKKAVARQQKMNPITRFFRETTGELRKVTWPTRTEAVNLTKIVIIVMILMAAFLASVDYLFIRLIAFILGR